LEISLESPEGGIQSLFSSPITTSFGYIAIGTSWWGFGEQDGFYLIKHLYDFNDYFTYVNRVYSTSFYAYVLNTNLPQIGITTEQGELILFNDYGKQVYKLNLPAGVEATPLIADIDNDGLLEMLIATRDKYLYCFDTKSNGKVYWGQFRGNNFNTGVYRDVTVLTPQNKF
jgi:hypothetical protein